MRVGAELQRQSPPFWVPAVAATVGGMELIVASALAYSKKGEAEYSLPGFVGFLSLTFGTWTIYDFCIRPDRGAMQSDVTNVVMQTALSVCSVFWAWNIGL